MIVEPILYLAGIDVLATADDQFLAAPHYLHIALFIHDADITRVQPAFIIYGFRRLDRVLPVTLHDPLAAAADLTPLANGHQFAARVSQLDLGVVKGAAHRGDALVQRR